MTIYINGTTGISGVDGSAGTPAVQGTDTNTGVFYPAADTVGLATNGTERMRVDSSGNVGIGTTTPGTYGKLVVQPSGNGYTAFTDSIGGGGGSQINMNYNGFKYSYIDTVVENGTAGLNASNLRFATAGSGTLTERMRIDSSGYVGIGTTSPSTFGLLTVENANNVRAGWFYVSAVSSLSTPAITLVKKDNNTTTSQVLATFYVNGSLTQQGQINANGANAAAFGSFSDSRLKENIVDLPSQLANIMALRPVEYDYIESEGGGHQIGFVAQEVQEIYPDLVGEREDGMLTLSDLNKNDARLIKAIQEQQALITALTARIEALEAK